MGHYASEMDPNWGSQDEDISAMHKAGFKVAYLTGLTDTYECPNCSALVKDWKKHKKFCNKV